ncbi:MAG: NYN domain-containing protein [Rickettsiales bacterium]|jgi:uncharacterized LabA/DUF88 family protein|nr:NYN domain-containing protein [Rickettsiales bacterium]
MCGALLRPDDELTAVKYFSAMKSDANNPQRALNQKIYFEALESTGKVSVELGFFSIRRVTLPLTSDWDAGRVNMVNVVKTEEKGTDVNLAIRMVADAKDDKFDYAMLFSNDSDMANAVKIANRECGKQIGLFIGRGARSYKVLHNHILHTKHLLPNLFAAHQFPNEIRLPGGRVITKPKDW